MFENTIFYFVNKNHNDYEGLLNYIYSLSDSGEKTFCVKDKNGQLLTDTSALRYCKENNLIYNDVFKFLNTHIMRIENNEITDQSAFTLNGNPQLADTILKETMHDTYFLQNSEGIWVLNATHKEIKTSDSAGNISSTWIPAYYSIFLLEDKNGNIATSTPECLNNIKISPDEELLKKNGFVSNDYLILKDKNGQFCYAYKNNQIVSFNSYEEAVKYSFSNEEIQTPENKEITAPSSTNNKLIIYIISAILVLFAIAELIYIIYIKSKKYKTHLNKKDKKLIFKIQDEERSKVSKDIHDSVVQNIRAIRLEAEMLEVTENSNQRKEKIVEEMTNVISLLRNICYNLSPAELSLAENMDNSNVELLSVIDTLSKQFTAKTKIPCAINLEKDIVLPELDVEVSRNVVRVVQECFNNIEKHSFATRVQILVKNEVKNNSRNLIIFIIDDGIGCEVKNLTNKKTHFGIRNMIERMNMVGGSIEFFSEPNEGLNIQLQIPYGE